MSNVETKTTSTSTTKSPFRLDHSQEYNFLRENYATKMAALTAHTTNLPNIDTQLLIRGFANSDYNPNKLSLAQLLILLQGSTTCVISEDYG